MLAVIIPAYNEEDRVEKTVENVSQIGPVSEVLVVDDGSTDATASVAKRAGAAVISLSRNRGKGYALNCGFAATRAPYLAFLDADLGASAVGLTRLWEPVEAGILDMSVAAPPAKAGSGGFGLVKGLAGWGIHRLSGSVFQAPLSGQRVLHRRVMHLLHPLASGFGVEIDLTLRALWSGFRVGEVPLYIEHRYTGRDVAGFCHRGRQFWHVSHTLTRLALSRRPES